MRIAVRRGGGYGDVLLTTPVIRAIRQKYPGCELTFITDQFGFNVLKGLPYIDDFRLFKGFHNVHNARLDGFDKDYSLVYEKNPNCHIIDAYTAQAEVTLNDKKPEIVMLESHHEAALKWLASRNISDSDMLIAIHRGPTWPCRSWHPLKFKAVAEYFKEKYDAFIIEFSGRPGFGSDWAADLSGRTSIRQTAALLGHCRLLICIDSFLLHLASVVDTPTVAIFGCTSPEYRLPFNNISIGVQTSGKCRGCYHDGRYKTYCKCFRERIFCMEEVGIRDVISAAEKLLYATH